MAMKIMRGCSPEERFDAKYKVNPETGCWEWTAYRMKEGYGVLGIRGHYTDRAHRFSYKRFRGPIPPGMLVCHTCDNPPCVNPEHLFLGTNADNVADRERKGRGRRAIGSLAGHAKLNERKVLRIKQRLAAGANQSAVARQYGVDQCAINHIARGRTWRHVQQEA